MTGRPGQEMCEHHWSTRYALLTGRMRCWRCGKTLQWRKPLPGPRHVRDGWRRLRFWWRWRLMWEIRVAWRLTRRWWSGARWDSNHPFLRKLREK